MAVIDTPGASARRPSAINSAGGRLGEREVSELCHDLRQPVAALIQLAAAASTADMSPPARERVAQINREAHRLSGMVQAVLTAPPVWEPVDLAEIARGVVQSARIAYGERFDVSAPGPAPVLGQRVQLDRALSNLVENAAHVGRGRVRVEVRTVGGRVRVGVEDDGPGLLHAPGSVSLGLLIVDRVVREHGGKVVVQDCELGGTRVEMGFPAADQNGSHGGLRLVLCDDHRLFVEALAVVLQERGWDVLAVVDRPDAAVEAVTIHHPDVCVLDALFDGDAAAAVAAAGKMRETSPDTRVVVLSGTDEPAVVGAAVTAGAAGYVLKTCEIDAITACIERVAGGEAVVDAELARRALMHRSDSEDAEVRLVRYLTGREREVLVRLVRGEDTGAIAARMGIRPATARSHIQNVLGKLGVHSRLEAVVLAARCGIGP